MSIIGQVLYKLPYITFTSLNKWSSCLLLCALLFRLRLDKSVSDEEIDSLTDDILENLGLSHVADNLVGGGLVRGGLSGGEKKRVQCGIELVTNPEIIVLDEPTSGKSYLPCHPSLSTIAL